MAFKITKGITAAGWLPGLGDTLRASGKSIVLMLSPTIGKPLTRIRILKTVAHLETRVHTASRCTRGTWLKIDSESVTGFKAPDWARLTKVWAWRIAEIETSERGYNWLTDSGKDRNRCGTTSNCNMKVPVSLQTLNEDHAGIGRGRLCKNRPNQSDHFGWKPATGAAVRTHSDVQVGCN